MLFTQQGILPRKGADSSAKHDGTGRGGGREGVGQSPSRRLDEQSSDYEKREIAFANTHARSELNEFFGP